MYSYTTRMQCATCGAENHVSNRPQDHNLSPLQVLIQDNQPPILTYNCPACRQSYPIPVVALDFRNIPK